MKSRNQQEPDEFRSGSSWRWFVTISCFVFLLLIILRPRRQQHAFDSAIANPTNLHAAGTANRSHSSSSGRVRAVSVPTLTRPAAEIVSEKVSQFARNHAEIVAAMAKKLNITLPADMNRFFTAVQSGRWEETTNLFASLQKLRQTTGWERGVETLWHPLRETYAVAEQAHNWPAQTLLDYGNAIVESLRPGMVYVGGTDAGRSIPALLTETGQGEPHIVLTQNSLADGTYLDYLRLRYEDRMSTLSSEESQTGFTTYIQDAQKRLQHDEQFPNEPKQIRPGEEVRVMDNRVQVSGQVAVMMINEQLVQKLLQKNPDLSFALEESTPLKSLYPGASTLGPVTELRADPAKPLTAEQAAQSLDYWRSTTQNLLADPEVVASNASRDAYSKLILGQANLFLGHNLSSEAEQAFRMANTLSPSQPAAVSGYANLLLDQKRYSEARQVVQTGLNLTPDNKQFLELQSRLSQLR